MPTKILVRSPNWIGDQLMAYSFFKELRRAFPRAHIAAACAKWVESIQFRSCVDEVYVLEAPASGRFFDKLSVLQSHSKDARLGGPWDLAISLPNSFSSAWFLWSAGARVRRGYSADLRAFLLTERISQSAGSHRAQDYLRLLPELPGFEPRGLSEHLFSPEVDWPSIVPFALPQQKYWVLAPGSVANSRRWRLEQFLELAALISQETGWLGVVIGGPAEKGAGQYLVAQLEGRLEDWTGKGSVASYWQLLREAQFVVSNDSGLAHLAALCARPSGLLHLIWGAGNPLKTLPQSQGRVQASMQSQLPCWPCERNSCPRSESGKNQCLEETSPQVVWNEIRLASEKLGIAAGAFEGRGPDGGAARFPEVR